MSTHDGLVLLAIYVGVIGAGALIEYVEHRVKRAIRRRKRSWKTSLFFIKKHLTFFAVCGIIISERERKIPNTRKVNSMTTIKTLLDGVLPVKPLSYVLGDDWTYLYSDTYKGVEFDVHACMNGEVVAVLN